LTDFAKLHTAFSKELQKLSHLCEGYVKADNNSHMDRWWNSFSIALDHLSQDNDYLGTAILSSIIVDLGKAEQEHVVKRLHNQGSKCVAKLTEANISYESKKQELFKLKEKAAASGGSLSIGEHSKLVLKMQMCETALKSARHNLSLVQEELDAELPTILADYKLIASSACDSTLTLLVKLTDLLVGAQSKSSHILSRLKVDMAVNAAKTIDKSNMYAPMVLEILERIEKGNTVHVDMKAETTAALACSSLADMPGLPPQFGRCLAEETCVWLNAFSGRMYRDAARSEYFHGWWCSKATHLLNKGKRPDFLDEFQVSDVAFGSSPPHLRNVMWLPHCPLLSGQKFDPDHNVACSADMSFRSGISFVVTTKYF
jgi:hypothetical protein